MHFLNEQYKRGIFAYEKVETKKMLADTMELELELIQTQMAQKPMLRVEVYARALRASQKRERERMCG